MESVAENIWAHGDTMRLAGTTLRLRMTVIKLEDGSLWVHSPTALSSGLKEQIEKLGPVAFIVGAGNGHNLWLQEWSTAFPEAVLYVSGGIPKKLKLTEYELLDDAALSLWSADLERQYMPGVGFFNESVFLHKKSQSLIVTDLIQNHSDERPGGRAGIVAKFIMEPIGFKDICIAPPLKMGFIHKDKTGFSTAIKNIQGWDFQRIIVTHGDIIETDAKAIFTRLCGRFVIGD